MNSSPHMDDGKPLSTSMYRTIAHKVLPTHLDIPIRCGMLVAAKSWIKPVSQAVRPELFPAVLAALVGAPTDVASAEEDERRPDEQSKRLKSLFVVSRQVNGGPPGVLVGCHTDVLVAAYGHWREGLSQDPAIQLERPDDLVGSCLGVSKLDCFPRGVNVTVQESPLEHNTSAVSIA